MKIQMVFAVAFFSTRILSAELLLLPVFNCSSPVYSIINPAQNLENSSKHQFQFLYQNKFGMQDLSPKFFTYARSFQKHILFFTVSDWGSAYYREQNVNFSYRMELGPKFNVGLGFASVFLQQNEINTKSIRLQPGFAINYQWTSFTEIFVSFQPEISLDAGKKASNSLLFFGGRHELSKNLKLRFLLSSSKDFKYMLSGGLLYCLQQGNELKLTLSNQITPLGLGYALTWKKIKCSFNLSYHFQLGFSNDLSFQLNH